MLEGFSILDHVAEKAHAVGYCRATANIVKFLRKSGQGHVADQVLTFVDPKIVEYDKLFRG